MKTGFVVKEKGECDFLYFV